MWKRTDFNESKYLFSFWNHTVGLASMASGLENNKKRLEDVINEINDVVSLKGIDRRNIVFFRFTLVSKLEMSTVNIHSHRLTCDTPQREQGHEHDKNDGSHLRDSKTFNGRICELRNARGVALIVHVLKALFYMRAKLKQLLPDWP